MELLMGTELLADDDGPGQRRTRRRTFDEGISIRCQLNVVAAHIGDVVQSVGGWLFDRSMAGWEVNVLLADSDGDTRPLRILGVQIAELEPGALSIGCGAGRAADLAIASILLGTNEHIDAQVGHALRRADIEVAVWGQGGSPGGLDRVQHRLTRAARLFKAHALAAAGLTDVPVGLTETLFRGGGAPPCESSSRGHGFTRP
jgi:hypothetical protein